MRKLATLGAIAGALVLAPPAVARWVLIPSHKQHAPRHCQTTRSPYINGPTSPVCCKWRTLYPGYGFGVWNCTIVMSSPRTFAPSPTLRSRRLS
jgi:hypothetical protein